MKVDLLTCIRAADERLRPAIEKQNGKRPFYTFLVKPFRVFHALTVLPLVWPKSALYYLTSYPRPNSKAGYVYEEMCTAGVAREAFFFPPSHGDGFWVRVTRFLVRLPWATLLYTSLLLRRRVSLDSIALASVIGRESFRRSLRQNVHIHPIIISDVSPTLHMLWSAAALEGNRAIWWQDDFHHHWRLPYDICAAAVLNEDGLGAARERVTAAVIAKRPTVPPRPLRKIPMTPRIGLATNASFCGSEEQRNLILSLADCFEVKYLELRLHPNSTLGPEHFQGCTIRLAPKDESMDEFASRIDLAVVGNSAAQVWLIRNGVPVLHVPGFDLQGYDLYGYVYRGFVLGAENLVGLSLDVIRLFYEQSPEVVDRIQRYTTITTSHDLRGLEHLAGVLAGSLNTGLTTRQHG